MVMVVMVVVGVVVVVGEPIGNCCGVFFAFI